MSLQWASSYYPYPQRIFDHPVLLNEVTHLRSREDCSCKLTHLLFFAGKVAAIDRDAGKHAKIFYYIISGNENGRFSLDRTTGNIYTNASFDREDKNEYNLFIKASNDPQYYAPEVNTVINNHTAIVWVTGLEDWSWISEVIKNVIFRDVSPCDYCGNRHFGGMWKRVNKLRKC